MSAGQDAPLSQLAQSLMEADASPRRMDRLDHSDFLDRHMDRHLDHKAEHHQADHGCAHSWVSFVFYFLVLALLFYFLYFALRPYFVLKQDKCDDSRSRTHSYSEHREDEIDNGRLLAAAVITALVLIFVFWLFAWAMGSF